MAGAIVVIEKGVSIGSGPFHMIVEKIRGAFRPGEEAVSAHVFSPMDDGGMDFITGIDLSVEDFKTYSDAVARAYRSCVEEGDLIVHQEIWDEILDAFQRDELNLLGRLEEVRGTKIDRAGGP